MDSTDFAIFRAMCGDGGARFFAARTVMDPRISAPDVAKKVGLSAPAVRTRLRRWRMEGVLRSYEVWPNPALFGVQFVSADLPLNSSQPADSIFKELELVEGVLFAREAIDEDRRVVIATLVSDTPASVARRVSLLARLSSQRANNPPRPHWLPPCRIELSGLDWRIIRTFRKEPLLSLPKAAREVGVSLKTLSKRFHRLLDNDAVWWTISVLNRMVPTVYVHIVYTDPEFAEAGAGDLAARFPSWIPAVSGGYGFPPEARSKHLVAVFPLEAPAGVAEILRAIHAQSGVVSVRRRFPGETVYYPDWFDRRIEEKIALSGTGAPSSEEEPLYSRAHLRVT